MSTVERKAFAILAAIATTEGAWVFLNLRTNAGRFWQWTGLDRPFQGGVADWALAILVAAAYVGLCARLPSVRGNLARLSLLKGLAVLVAVAAGLCEEAVFRKLLMDALERRGFGVVLQILASGAGFGAVHAIWGLFKGSPMAAAGAMIATG